MKTENKKPFRIQDRIQSIRFAVQGLKHLLQSEHNARIHAVATIVVIIISFLFQLNRGEWLWILACIALVWSAELFNTALERLCDRLHPERHPLIGQSKDLSSAAVLVLAIFSLVVAGFIFIPKIISLFSSFLG